MVRLYFSQRTSKALVLETKEEAELIYEAMSNSFLISSEDYYKLKAAIKIW